MKKHSFVLLIAAVFLCISSQIYPQLKDNSIQIGYEQLFTKSTRSRYIDWLKPEKGRQITNINNSNFSAVCVSYMRVIYPEEKLNVGFRGGFLFTGERIFQKVFIGLQLRYNFSDLAYLFNEYTFGMATWMKEGGNSTRQPYDQTWGSLGLGFHILKNLFGSVSYSMTFSKAVAVDKIAGYYNDKTEYESYGFIHAGFEVYF